MKSIYIWLCIESFHCKSRQLFLWWLLVCISTSIRANRLIQCRPGLTKLTISILCSSCLRFFSLACRSVTSWRASSMLVTCDCREVMLELWDWNTCLCRCTTLLACDVYFSNCTGISMARDWTDLRSFLIVWNYKMMKDWICI